jgi:dipeptidyl aminopeptidase/acylaminoacyl peptidase
MTQDGRHLAAVPDRTEQRLLEWLNEPEGASASDVLDRAFAQLPAVRRVRRMPWDDVLERLRPEPFGRSGARLALLLLSATLVLVALTSAVITGAIRLNPTPPPPPPPTAPAVLPSGSPIPAATGSPTPAAVFPLADPPLEFVIDDNGVISVLGSDGSERRRVGADITGLLVSPEWLPGTDRLIVQDWAGDTDQVWDVDAAGDRRSLVVIPCVDPCRSRNEASPSRDGSRIVFFQAFGDIVEEIPADCGLAIYELSTQAITTVTESPCAIVEERHPRFSPDGDRLAFWRSRSPGGERVPEVAESALFIRDLDTMAEIQVTDWDIDASLLDWSPDGEWLAFVPRYWDDSASGADVHRIRVDGTGLERLTSLDTATNRILRPRYTPDGAWILFMRQEAGSGSLFAIPAEGGEPVEVLPGTQVFDYDVRTGG